MPVSIAVAPLVPVILGGYVSAFIYADGEYSKAAPTVGRAACVCKDDRDADETVAPVDFDATGDGDGDDDDDDDDATPVVASPYTPFAGHGYRTRGFCVVKVLQGALEVIEFESADAGGKKSSELFEL